eukprot:g3217.t1
MLLYLICFIIFLEVGHAIPPGVRNRLKFDLRMKDLRIKLKHRWLSHSRFELDFTYLPTELNLGVTLDENFTITSFMPHFDGGMGVIESTGYVEVNDKIVTINELSLKGRSYEEVRQHFRRVGSPHEGYVLHIERPLMEDEEKAEASTVTKESVPTKQRKRTQRRGRVTPSSTEAVLDSTIQFFVHKTTPKNVRDLNYHDWLEIFHVAPADFGTIMDQQSGSKPIIVGLPSDGCTKLQNKNVIGKIVMVNRGGCSFTSKARNIEESSAAAALIVNNNADLFTPRAAPGEEEINIPVFLLKAKDGARILELRDKSQNGSAIQAVRKGAAASSRFPGTLSGRFQEEDMSQSSDGKGSGGKEKVDDIHRTAHLHVFLYEELHSEIEMVPASFSGRFPPIKLPIVSTDPINGCFVLRNSAALAGKIAIVERGGCTFFDKAELLERAGAKGMILVNTNDEIFVMHTEPRTKKSSIAAVQISKTDGDILRNFPSHSTVRVLLHDTDDDEDLHLSQDHENINELAKERERVLQEIIDLRDAEEKAAKELAEMTAALQEAKRKHEQDIIEEEKNTRRKQRELLAEQAAQNTRIKLDIEKAESDAKKAEIAADIAEKEARNLTRKKEDLLAIVKEKGDEVEKARTREKEKDEAQSTITVEEASKDQRAAFEAVKDAVIIEEKAIIKARLAKGEASAARMLARRKAMEESRRIVAGPSTRLAQISENIVSTERKRPTLTAAEKVMAKRVSKAAAQAAQNAIKVGADVDVAVAAAASAAASVFDSFSDENHRHAELTIKELESTRERLQRSHELLQRRQERLFEIEKQQRRLDSGVLFLQITDEVDDKRNALAFEYLAAYCGPRLTAVSEDKGEIGFALPPVDDIDITSVLVETKMHEKLTRTFARLYDWEMCQSLLNVDGIKERFKGGAMVLVQLPLRCSIVEQAKYIEQTGGGVLVLVSRRDVSHDHQHLDMPTLPTLLSHADCGHDRVHTGIKANHDLNIPVITILHSSGSAIQNAIREHNIVRGWLHAQVHTAHRWKRLRALTNISHWPSSLNQRTIFYRKLYNDFHDFHHHGTIDQSKTFRAIWIHIQALFLKKEKEEEIEKAEARRLEHMNGVTEKREVQKREIERLTAALENRRVQAKKKESGDSHPKHDEL